MMWMDLKIIMPHEKSQTKKGACSAQVALCKLLENANQGAVGSSTSGLAWDPGCAAGRQKAGVPRGVRKPLGAIGVVIILTPVMVSQVYIHMSKMF